MTDDIRLQLANRALTIMKNEESTTRRANIQKRIDYYFGDKQTEYLDDLLKKQFTFPDRLKLQKEIYNITEMIINEVAVLYNEEPYREIMSDDEPTQEQDQEIYSELIEKSRINSAMKTAQRLTKLCKTALVRPAWRDGHIEYDIYTPNMFDVLQDPANQTKATAIIYASVFDLTKLRNPDQIKGEDKFGNQKAIFYYWSAVDHFIFSAELNSLSRKWEATFIEQADNPENRNPYGIIPFVILRDGVPIDNFYLPGGDELIQCNEINNVKLTEKNNLTKMQSFSIPVRKGGDSNVSFILDPSMTVDLPLDNDLSKGSDFRFVSPDPKIQALADDINDRVKRLSIKYNLNPERFNGSAQRQSAEAMQLTQYDMAKQLKADKPDWTLYEKELFDLTKIIHNYHTESQPFSDGARLFVDYKDVESPMTIAEKDQHNILMYENDLLTKEEWLMEENTDVRSEEEATEIITKNREKKEALAEEKRLKYAKESIDAIGSIPQFKPATEPDQALNANEAE